MRSFILSCVMVLLASTCATAQIDAAWLFTFPSTMSRQAPRITKGGNGALVVTYIERTGSNANVFVITSADNGRSWTVPSQVTTVQYGSIGLQRQPHTVVGGDGTLHCVWEHFWNQGQLSIFHSRSTDNGTTWTTATPLYDVRDGRMQEFSTVAAGRDGLVYASFISADINDLDGYQHLLMVRSTDGGETWSDPVRVDNFSVEGGSCECCQPHAAVAPDGTVGVAFRANLKNQRDVYLATSTDDGLTFQPPSLLQNGTWTIAGCPATGPKIRFDAKGTVHAVWRDTRDAVGKSLSYYAQYQPGTRVIPQNLDLTTPVAKGSEYADVAVSPDGDSLCVILETTRGVQILRSVNGGQSFQSEIVDAFAIQGVSGHVVWTDAGEPFAVWQSTRGTQYDLRISRNQTTSVDDRASGPGAITAKRMADGWAVMFEGGVEVQATASLFNVLGQEIDQCTLANTASGWMISPMHRMPFYPVWTRIGDRFILLP